MPHALAYAIDGPTGRFSRTTIERREPGPTEVLFDIASRGRYATDASIYQQLPVGVFVPKTQRDVAIALQIARELGAPLLPRGGGTSQCGQTTGTALVIDFSKHLRRVLSLDVEALRAEVEPGLVLDHLNAELKKHGLWYPVDVSTGAQATLGGMAGNNSCGSRSIAYGNMVHNVARIAAWMADGGELDFGPLSTLGTKEREIADFVRGLAEAVAPEIDAHWPTVMRRVAGYNLDIFRPRSERPYTADGSVNLAHLLVGAEGTLALTRSLTLALAPLPRHKVLGVVNFARFHTAMDSAQHIVKLGPSAVELVDRTMIELARANPAFRPVIETALIGAPDAILLVEFSGEERAPLLDGEAIVVRVAGDVGPAEVPRLVRRGHGEQVVELAHRDQVLGARPALEHLVVVTVGVLARSLRERHLVRAAGRREQADHHERDGDRPAGHRHTLWLIRDADCKKAAARPSPTADGA